TAFLADVLVGPPGSREPRRGSGFGSLGFTGSRGPVPVQVLGKRRAHERMDSARHYPDQDEVEGVRVALRLPELGGFGAEGFGLESCGVARGAGARPGGRARARGNRLENGLVEARVTGDGRVTLMDRVSGDRFEDLLGLESNGDVGDTYTYAAPRGDRTRSL